jgi:hypothetical protein
LDEWPGKYINVKICEHLGAGVAPWNVTNYRILMDGESISGIEKKTGQKFTIIFYHFHFVRFLDNGFVDIGWNWIPDDAINYLYIPYINELNSIEKELKHNFSDYHFFYHSSRSDGFSTGIKKSIKNLTKFNLLKPAICKR